MTIAEIGVPPSAVAGFCAFCGGEAAKVDDIYG